MKKNLLEVDGLEEDGLKGKNEGGQSMHNGDNPIFGVVALFQIESGEVDKPFYHKEEVGPQD